MRSILLLAPRTWKAEVKSGILWGLLFVAVIWLMRCDTARKVDAWQAERAALLIQKDVKAKQVRKDSALVASHAKANALLASELAHTQYLLRMAHAKRDTVWQRIVLTAPDTCKPIIAIAEGYRAEADTLDHALTRARGIITQQTDDIARLQGSNASLLQLNDSLASLAKRAPIKPKLFGLLPMPSRTQALVAGVAIGAIGMWELKR